VTRIVGVPEKDAGLLGRFAYRFSRRRFGKVPEPVRVTAHHRKVLLGMSAMELALDRSNLVDARLKKLAEMKVALVVGCEFCVDIGSMLGKGLGITDDQLRALPRFRESAAFSSVGKLVLEYAAEMTRTPAVIPDHLYGALSEYFDEAQMVELTAAIAWENHPGALQSRLGHGLPGLLRRLLLPLTRGSRGRHLEISVRMRDGMLPPMTRLGPTRSCARRRMRRPTTIARARPRRSVSAVASARPPTAGLEAGYPRRRLRERPSLEDAPTRPG
jgi:AhpD family alkylhydroperoxidase